MLGRKKPEVLIVGAGPVGLFAALVLAKRGIPLRIVDRDWRTGAHSYALALHGRSLPLLDDVGLREDVLRRAYPVRSIGLYDDQARRVGLRLSKNGDDAAAPAVLRQDALEGVFEEALARLGVRVEWNHEVSSLTQESDGVRATIDRLEKESVGYAAAHTEWVVAGSKQVKVPFVLAADGHRSRVRRALGIDFAEAGPAQHFAVFEFRSSADFGHEMRVALGESGTAAAWPLPDGHCRWSFELPDLAAPESARTKERLAVQLGGGAYPALAEESLRELLARRAAWFEGSVEEVRWRIAVRFERRLAGAFGRDRAWLAGDAGHVTGPVGMQSMNVGLLEARELAEIFGAILEGRESLSRLAEYNRQRIAQWRFLLGLEGGLQPGGEADPWICRNAPRLLPCLPASGPDLAALAAQLGLRAAGRDT